MKQINQNFIKHALNYYTGFLCLCLIAAYFVHFQFPESVKYIIEEDHLVETLSAFFYLIAFILAVWVLKKNKRRPKFSFFVAVIALVGFLDEISFGERLFNLDMPEILGVNIDAVHDFLSIMYLYATDILGLTGLISILLSLIVIAAAVIAFYLKISLQDITAYIKQNPPVIFLIFFAFFLTTASIIDLKEDMIPLVIVEELFEMYAGLALCLYSVTLIKSKRKLQIVKSAANEDHTKIKQDSDIPGSQRVHKISRKI